MAGIPDGFDVGLAARVFDAAIDQDLWADLIHELAISFGAITGCVISVNQVNGDGFQGAWFSREVQRALQTYNDTLSKHEADGIPIIANSVPHTVLTELDLWPDDPNLYSRPDFRWFEENVGFRHRIAAKLSEDQTFFNTFAVQFHHSRGQATASERELFRAYLPFLEQSVRLANVFQTLKQHFNAVLSVMDKYLVPVVIVDANARRIVSNKSADTIIDNEGLVRFDPTGRLYLLNNTGNERLRAAISTASYTASGHESAPVDAIQVPKANGQDTLWIEVAPLRDTDQELESHFQGAIIKIYDPSYHPHISIDGFGAIFNLTDGEMGVARLMVDGLSTDEIAEMRGASPNTVRTQIKSVLSKTRSSNRTALVRKALSAHLPIDVGS